MSVSSISSKIIGPITKFKPVQKYCEYYKKEPAKAITSGVIASLVIKDTVGCAMYVYQSLHNDKIPENKRGFVAAYDLTNGILMVTTQILAALTMRKINNSLFPKIFKNSFDKEGNVFKAISTLMRKEESDKGLTRTQKIEFKKAYETLKKACFDIFGFVTELVASTIVAKRILVPMISTSMAKGVEKKMGKSPKDMKKGDCKEENKSENKEEKNISTKKEIPQFVGENKPSNLLAAMKK